MKKDLSLPTTCRNFTIPLLIAVFVFALITRPLPAQTTGNIEGTALDGSGPAFLVGATVELIGTSITTMTNSNGFYTFRNIAAGNYNIRLTILGSLAATFYNISVEAGSTTIRNLIVNDNQFHIYFTDDEGTGTLRQAIINANGHVGRDNIEFHIPGNQIYTITPATPLPDITEQVTIDGYTQGGAYPADPSRDASINIIIDGNLISHETGLRIDQSTGQCNIRGLQISGFTSAIVIAGTQNAVQGCRLLNNHGNGLLVEGTDNLIGGPAPLFRNIISGNATGVAIAPQANENNILGNYIGTDISGLNQLRNHESGIRIGSDDNQVGGVKEEEGNIISGNLASGILLHQWNGSTDIPERNKIYNNWIGVSANPDVTIPNADGVHISEGKDNIVKGNKILHNTGSGVIVYGSDATGNHITQNRIHANGALGIDLNRDEVTENDSDDSDTGPNNLQNYPVLLSASRQNNQCSINGFLRTSAQAEFDIEIYYSDEIDASNHGEGQNYLGMVHVQSDEHGLAEFSADFSNIPPDDVYFSALTIDAGNNTSEYSESIHWCAGSEPEIHIAYPLFVNRGQEVVLDASASFDCQDSHGQLMWQWEQVPTAGDPFVSNVIINNASTAIATFTAPIMVESLTFSFRITDTDGNSVEKQLIVTILENIEQAVFVSSYLGINENPGTREKPVGTLHHALEIAAASTPNADIYAGAMLDYSERENTLQVEDHTSIYGGFDIVYNNERGNQWVRTTKPSRILGASTALSLTDIIHPTTIDGLQIEAADGAPAEEGEPGTNSIGIKILNSTDLLHITNNIIMAGQGSAGSHGFDGASGDNGENGLEGATFGYGGDGGVQNTGRNGGRGGDGGLVEYLPVLTNPANLADFAKDFDLDNLMEAGDGKRGENGALGSTGFGGAGGDARHRINRIYPPPTCSIPLPTLMIDGNNDGFPGQNGQSGGKGTDGNGGSSVGAIENFNWISGAGLPGTIGASGYGGGGGGGGTAYSEMVEVAIGGISFCINKIYLPVTVFGGGGGGGGASGYGGSGGTGGKGGGASFGIFLYQSNPFITHNKISTAEGGEGGWGRRGGLGGSGGFGGEGYAYTIGPINMVDMSKTIRDMLNLNAGDGAVGGRGGMGGSGGHGGGGGGGASCGIYIYNSDATRPVLLSNIFNEQLVSLLGSPGAGGRPNGESGIGGPVCPPPGILPVQDVPVVVMPGETESINCDISTDVSGAVFSSVWSGSDIVMSLTTPAGKVINRNTSDQNIQHKAGPSYEYYMVKNPSSGSWEIKLLGADVPVNGEETLINVELSPQNQPPIAISKKVILIAGDTGTAEASVDSASYDPDCCDVVTITQTPTGPYTLGITEVVLKIEDQYGADDTDTAYVTVVDRTPPVISGEKEYIVSADASFYPVGTTFVNITAIDSSGNQSFCIIKITVVEDNPPHIDASLLLLDEKPDNRKYLIHYTVDDQCDNEVAVSALIRIPVPEDTTDWKMKFKTHDDFKVKIQENEKIVDISCPEPDNLWHFIREFGGIPVFKGQMVNIVPVSDMRSNCMYEYKKDGTLMIKDPEPALVVKAMDQSGNSSIVIVGPDGEIYRDSTSISLPQDTVISAIESDLEDEKEESESGQSPDKFIITQNYPNPFNPVTQIGFTLPKSEYVTLKVYNLLGVEVKTLISAKLYAGEHRFTFDGRGLASGIYYYEIVAGGNREVRKMVLLK